MAKTNRTGVDNIQELIDRLGDVRRIQKQAKADEEKILTILKEDASLKVGATYHGSAYDLTLQSRVTTTLDPELVKKVLKDDKKFMAIISVTKTAAAKFLSESDLDKCAGDRKETVAYATKERVEGK